MCKYTERLEIDSSKIRVHIQHLKLFHIFWDALCVSFALRCRENEKHVLGIFQQCEAFSNLYVSVSGRGRMRPLHCNCLRLMCSSVVHHQSLARYLTDWLSNALLQPDEHAAGVFTCTTQQANHHLVLTEAFREPMMSAFNLPSCVLSVHLLYITLLILWLTLGQYYTRAWINKISLTGVQQSFSMIITATYIWGMLVLGWWLELSYQENHWTLTAVIWSHHSTEWM